MASVAQGPNTKIFAEDWAQRLQDQLDEPNKFKEICDVEFTDFYTLNRPYHVDGTVATLNPGTAYTLAGIAETNETLTVNQHGIRANFIDQAALLQFSYLKQMEMATRHAVTLNEDIETKVYADFANWTTFDGANIGGSAGSITVSATNIDDIITGIVREIREANGESLLERNGGFIVWRPADFELLQRFMMANGFNMADQTLRNGTVQGIRYMGIAHYSSNLLTAQHVMAGVKKIYSVGILRATYGQVKVNDSDPNLLSGLSVVSRVDFGVKAWNNTKTCLFNVLVV